jgi:hypothetical protein
MILLMSWNELRTPVTTLDQMQKGNAARELGKEYLCMQSQCACDSSFFYGHSRDDFTESRV